MRIALTKYTRFADLPVNENLTMATVVHVDRHMLRNVAESASKLLWQVETDLEQRGYHVGPIDGTTDQHTFRAILDYEEDNGCRGTANSIRSSWTAWGSRIPAR
jgi:hypothetical protein